MAKKKVETVYGPNGQVIVTQKKKKSIWPWIIGGILVIGGCNSLLKGTDGQGTTTTTAISEPAQETAIEEPASSWSDEQARRLLELLKGEGLTCIDAESGGKSCADNVNGIGSVTLALKDGRETLLIGDPEIDVAAFSPTLTSAGNQGQLINDGPLTGYYFSEITTNSGPQYNLRNEASQQEFGN